MSLLNDALRGAEQRRERPAPVAYTGAAVAPAGRPASVRLGLWAVFALLALVLLLGWLWWSQNRTPAVPLAPPMTGSVERAPVAAPVSGEAMGQPQAVSEQKDPEPITGVITAAAAAPENESRSSERTAPDSQAPAAETDGTEAARAGEDLLLAEQEPLAHEEPSADKQPAADNQPAVGETLTAGDEPPAAIKQQRQTPELVDRRTEAELEKLLARGRLDQAEQTLARVVADQTAPLSRARLARYLIVAGQPARALDWLPEAVSRDHARLRLLRARALLAQGNPEQALATLEASVPPVARHAEYLVTLATLLQQQGRPNDAVGRWAELVAQDDSRAAWWVGLGSALEADGQGGGARRAYRQALALSDLPPTLADFCRQRLRALGAG